MIFVYITCKDKKEAEKIGLVLLKKKLVACSVVVPNVNSFYFWPPRSKKVERSNETILLLKTLPDKFSQIEQEVRKIHSYDIPFVASVALGGVNKAYLKWLKTELE